MSSKNISISEDNGLALMKDDDKLIYSIGVSTGGIAEIRMVQDSPSRYVIATTVDEKGIKDAKEYIKKEGFESQIQLKLEDVSKKLPYTDNFFDFIYARLVLHYLSKDELDATLQELKRILKDRGIIYVVVRSLANIDAENGINYEEKTGFTYYHQEGNTNMPIKKRYFHTEDSISAHLERAGFVITGIKSYSERLFIDFMRTTQSKFDDTLIEVKAQKI